MPRPLASGRGGASAPPGGAPRRSRHLPSDRSQRPVGAQRRRLKPQRNRGGKGRPSYYGQWKRCGQRFIPHQDGLGLNALRVPSTLHLHAPCVAAACFPTWRLFLDEFTQAKKTEILQSNLITYGVSFLSQEICAKNHGFITLLQTVYSKPYSQAGHTQEPC